jgi:hypothetical protein
MMTDNLDRLSNADLARHGRMLATELRARIFREGKRLKAEGWSVKEMEEKAIECDRLADELEKGERDADGSSDLKKS